jgi:hypothetical protein
MKIEFNDEEVAALPGEVREKVTENVFEGSPLDFIPDVNGLKSALEVTRAGKKTAEGLVKTIADKFGAKKSDVLHAVDDFISKNGKKGEVMKQLADERMRTVIAQAGGNIHTLPENVKARMQWSEELGQYFVPGEDGEPLKTDDGSLKGVPDVVADMKADQNFGNMFASRTHSGTGSPPQKGGDGPNHLQSDGRIDSDAPPKSMRISDMNSQQRRLAATEGGGLQEYQR